MFKTIFVKIINKIFLLPLKTAGYKVGFYGYIKFFIIRECSCTPNMVCSAKDVLIKLSVQVAISKVNILKDPWNYMGSYIN